MYGHLRDAVYKMLTSTQSHSASEHASVIEE